MQTTPFLLFFVCLVLAAGVAAAYVPLSALAILLLSLAASAAIFYFSAPRGPREKPGAVTERSELASITSILEDALIAYDENFIVLFWNHAAEKLFGLESKEVVGTQLKPQDAENPKRRVLAQVVFPSLAPRMIPRSNAGAFPQVVDVAIDDPQLELRVITAPVSRVGDVPRGFLKIVKNRTREVALLKSKNEFISVASHQLRTPMNEILWALQAIHGNESLSPDAKELSERALHSAEQLVSLVDDILNITRIEEGRFGYSFESADIVEFLGKTSGNILPQAERAGVKLYFDQPKDKLPKVMIDEKKLSMAMNNLLENAIRYNVEHGEVVLGVKKVEDQPFIEVNVKDTGIGIPPGEVNRLFTKFFRADNAVRLAPDGSGLGLYITQNVVRAHGGQMRVESELNRGSTFSFTLPTDPSMVPSGEVALE